MRPQYAKSNGFALRGLCRRLADVLKARLCSFCCQIAGKLRVSRLLYWLITAQSNAGAQDAQRRPWGGIGSKSS